MTKKIEEKKPEEQKGIMPVHEVTAVEIYTEDGLTGVLEKMKKEVGSFVPDLTTAEGRKAITSLAYNVTRSKTYLDDIGKDMVAEWKEKAKSVDSKRRWMRDELDALRDQIKAPLVAWQKEEEERVAKISNTINNTIEAGKNAIQGYLSTTLDELLEIRTHVEEIDPEHGFGDFKDRMTEVRLEALEQIELAISHRNTYDVEQTELAELRAEKEKRDEADRIEREAREKAEREQREKEEREAREKAIADKAKKEAEAREKQAIKDKADAEKREQKAKADAEKAKKLAEKQAKEAKELAEKKAKEAKIQAEKDLKDAQEKAEREAREKLEREEQARKAEAEKRERNTRHKAKINNEAVEDLVKNCKLSEEQAKIVVTQIAKKKIRNTSITY